MAYKIKEMGRIPVLTELDLDNSYKNFGKGWYLESKVIRQLKILLQ